MSPTKTAAITALFTAARSLAIAHMGQESGHMNFDASIGDILLVIHFNGALYSVAVIDLEEARKPVDATSKDSTLAVEWDSGVLTAINLCAAKVGA